MPRHERGEDEAGVVTVPPEFGQIHVQFDIRSAHAHRVRQSGEVREGTLDLPSTARELPHRAFQDRDISVEADERGDRPGVPRLDAPTRQQPPDLCPGLALQDLVELSLTLARQRGATREGPEDPDMAHVEVHRPDAASLQRLQHQADDLAVALAARVAVQLRPDLDRAAGARDPLGQGMQNRPDVAQARGTLPAQTVGVDARDLGGHVRPDPHHPARQLVDQLEGVKIEVLAGARQQRLQVFDERGGDDLVAPSGEQVEQRAPRPLEPRRLRRHELPHALGKQPALSAGLHRTVHGKGAGRGEEERRKARAGVSGRRRATGIRSPSP